MKPLATTAVLAGPPKVRPVARMAASMRNLLPPDISRKPPNMIKKKTYKTETLTGMPNMPVVAMKLFSTKLEYEILEWPRSPGKYGPRNV
jgi:hypothetical protein